MRQNILQSYFGHFLSHCKYCWFLQSCKHEVLQVSVVVSNPGNEKELVLAKLGAVITVDIHHAKRDFFEVIFVNKF